MPDDKVHILPGSNGAFAQNALQIHYALKQPKAHIPIGLAAFGLTAMLSAIPALPFAVAGLVAYDAMRRLRKNRKLVTESIADPTRLFNGLKPDQQSAVTMFLAAYPPEKPLGQPSEKKLPPLPRGGASIAPSASQTPAQKPSDLTKTQGSGLTVDPSLQWRDGEHFVMVGLSGSSKTTTLLNCVPTNSLVVYVTLKSEDKAPREWKAYRLRKFPDLSFLVQLENLCAMVRGLVQNGTKHRLIIDEALTILEQGGDALKTLTEKEDKVTYGAVVAEFEGLLKMYIRTGRSDGHWLGMVTQSPNGTDLFRSAKTMQGLKTVLCAGEASSNKFDFLPDWATQKFGQFVSEDDKKFFHGLRSGFWHFWVEDGKVQRRQTPRNTRPLEDIPMLSRYEPLAQVVSIEPRLHGEEMP